MSEFVIYCDESRHDGASCNKYMAIGGLWLPRNRKEEFTKQLRSICKASGLNAELKWSKVSRLHFEGYKRVIDYFFNNVELNFRVIVIDQRKLDNKKFHGGDRELGFYKFYYEMIEKWIDTGNRYLILLDYKQNKGADRYKILKLYLERKFIGKAWFTDLTVIDSHQTPLAQLTDLLTGAVSSVWSEAITPGGAKEELAAYISTRRRTSLKQPTTSPAVTKFNIFEIALS